MIIASRKDEPGTEMLNQLIAAKARIRELEAQLAEAEKRATDWESDWAHTEGERVLTVERAEQAEAQLAECETAFMAGKTKHEFDDANNAHTECPHDAGTNARHWWTRGYSYSARMLRAMEAEADAARLRAALAEYADAANWYVDRESGPAHWGWLGGDPTAFAQLALSHDARQPHTHYCQHCAGRWDCDDANCEAPEVRGCPDARQTESEGE